MGLILLVDGHAGAMEVASSMVRLAGMDVDPGWVAPERPWNLAAVTSVRAGLVEPRDGDAVVELAVRGANLVVGISPRFGSPARLVDALERAGAVHDWRGRRVLGLAPVQVQVLHALGSGQTVADAARASYLSVRSTHRQIALARDALLVDSTTQAAGLVHRLVAELAEAGR